MSLAQLEGTALKTCPAVVENLISIHMHDIPYVSRGISFPWIRVLWSHQVRTRSSSPGNSENNSIKLFRPCRICSRRLSLSLLYQYWAFGKIELKEFGANRRHSSKNLSCCGWKSHIHSYAWHPICKSWNFIPLDPCPLKSSRSNSKF